MNRTMSCPFTKNCVAFNAITANADKQYLAWAFCLGEHTDCGRYKALMAGDTIPEGLMPDGDVIAVAKQEKSHL
jgi:hypothetical protein